MVAIMLDGNARSKEDMIQAQRKQLLVSNRRIIKWNRKLNAALHQ